METGLSSIAVPLGLWHGSYLQGMETFIAWFYKDFLDVHGSYLQGMETRHPRPGEADRGNARILPTRNGNSAYKRRQLNGHKWHGSYLQGMETRISYCYYYVYWAARILPTRNGNPAMN